jgi:hypothetical protein
MKFAHNRMYIESYTKCQNCGLLLYERPANADAGVIVIGGKTYCSSWCVEWESERTRRQAAESGAR